MNQPVKKAVAKILIEDKDQKGNVIKSEVITVEGGLVRWDEDNLVFLLPEGGEATYPKDDVEDLKITDELFVLKKTTTRVTETKAAPVKKEKENSDTPKTLKPGSALEQVVNICRANPTLTRKQMIAKILEAMPGKTEGFASTYHNMAMKHIKGE